MTKTDKTSANFTAACSLISSIATQLGAKIPRVSTISVDNVSKFETAIRKAIDDLKDSNADVLPVDRVNTFDDLVDREIARLGDDAKPRPPEPNALAKRGAPAIDVPTDASVALFGLEVLVDIGRELGIDVVGQTPGDAARSIHAALLKLKSPGDLGGEDGSPASKGDSLAEAMSFGRKAEAAMLEEVTRLRLVVQRVAGAMQVPSWDKDGTEIIEKAQRWDQARYAVKRRITELEGGHPDVDDYYGIAAVTELRYMLGLLASPREIAKWLANKPKAVATVRVLDILENKPTDLGTFKPLVPADTETLAHMMENADAAPAERQEVILRVFDTLACSVTASTEFCDLVNLIILPILARQNPTTH